jgi:hypothetical protein
MHLLVNRPGFEANAPRSGPRTAGISADAGNKAKAARKGSKQTMKRFAGWAACAGLIVATSAANAQMLAPYDAGRVHYQAASDFDQPYAEPPPTPYEAPPTYGTPPAYGIPPAYGAPPVYGAPPPPYVAPPPYAYEPAVLPPQEVYVVLRENGFLPLGIPRLRGWVYTIAAMDRAGENGRLLIDAHSGRIIRFMPDYWGGGQFEEGLSGRFGPEAALPPTAIRGVPRPPLPIPHAENRAVPLPMPKPPAGDSGEPTRQSAADARTGAEIRTTPLAAPPTQAGATVGEVKGEAKPKPPAPQILPTQEMPKVQALE